MIEAQEIKYKGLTVKLAGDRTFENWTVGIYNDTEFSARTGIEQWMQDIVPLDSSVGPVGYDYMVDKATVSQLGRDDSVLATYEFFNMWPTNLGAIELDTEGGDAVEIFTGQNMLAIEQRDGSIDVISGSGSALKFCRCQKSMASAGCIASS